MRKTAKAIAGFGLILFLLEVVGCGKGEKKFIDKYISEGTVDVGFMQPRQHQILEIKKDGTWEISPSIGGSSGAEWKVDKQGIVLYAGKTQFLAYIGEMRDNKLIERLYGETFVKQD